MPAMLPLLGMGLTALNMLRPKPKTGMVDPRMYQDYLRYSKEDLSKIRQDMLSDINMLNMGNIGRIQQIGASRRMPAGAVTSAIANTAYQSGKAASRIEPKLAMLQKGADRDYFAALNQYGMAGAQAENMGMENTWGTLGSLGKIALLWQGGFFDRNRPGIGMGYYPYGPLGTPGGIL